MDLVKEIPSQALPEGSCEGNSFTTHLPEGPREGNSFTRHLPEESRGGISFTTSILASSVRQNECFLNTIMRQNCAFFSNLQHEHAFVAQGYPPEERVFLQKDCKTRDRPEQLENLGNYRRRENASLTCNLGSIKKRFENYAPSNSFYYPKLAVLQTVSSDDV